ncbi:hypothetical protein LTR27_008746 [Elasticomyces elasticus]|nr:hypothetical protein LTR27_008746 [Elasticomyces elasticus]
MASSQVWEGASPYDEDEFLGLVTDIYKILVRQGHFKEEDVIWDGHKTVSLSELENPHLIDPRVVSLMRKLHAGPSSCIAPNMQPVGYLTPGELIRSRDIDMAGAHSGSGVDQTNALPTVLQWLDGFESTDPILVLDVADSRIVSGCLFGPEFQQIMIEDYHWPSESFRRQDWDRDIDGLVGRMIDAEFGREARAEDVKQDVPTSPVLDPELFE